MNANSMTEESKREAGAAAWRAISGRDEEQNWAGLVAFKKEATRFFVDTAGQFTWVEKYAEPVSDLALAVGLWNERRAKERYANNPETLELCLAYLRSEAAQKSNADFAKGLLEDYHRKPTVLPPVGETDPELGTRIRQVSVYVTAKPIREDRFVKTPADLDWSKSAKSFHWQMREVVWTNLSTGETVTCHQPVGRDLCIAIMDVAWAADWPADRPLPTDPFSAV